MMFTLDSTVGDLLKEPEARTVLDQYLPGISTNPMLAMIQGVSLNMLLAMPQAAQLGLTKQQAEAMLAEVNKRV